MYAVETASANVLTAVEIMYAMSMLFMIPTKHTNIEDSLEPLK